MPKYVDKEYLAFIVGFTTGNLLEEKVSEDELNDLFNEGLTSEAAV